MSGSQATQIHNERTKLLATALNNIGVGAILAGIVTPMIRGDINAVASFVVWLVIGLDFLWLAYIVLGRLRAI
ncbi:MAG: hypothetical protein ABSC06_35090 [Rhodopila sp.]|jgi:methylmalonyl-CoA mutase cobalamin-binding subunit